jgi:hypothetical protein
MKVEGIRMGLFDRLLKIGNAKLMEILNQKTQTMITWPEGTEYLSDGPFFDKEEKEES